MANERVDIRLTEGDDLYVWDKTSWAFIYTLGGNDTVKASQGADIELGPGNDTLINVSGNRWVTATYHSSPQAVEHCYMRRQRHAEIGQRSVLHTKAYPQLP